MNVSVRANARVAESARGGVVAGAERGVPWRCRDRHAGRRAGAVRSGRLLRRAHLDRGGEPAPGDRRADRPRLRRLADLGVRPSGRRHLHEGRRRRRGPRRQDRGRDPRGRPAQPGRDRRQRRRQRRRLRRHGGRPVRDLRGHGRRGDAARRRSCSTSSRRWRCTRSCSARVSIVASIIGTFAVRSQGRQRRARPLPGADPVRGARRAGVPPGHLLDDAQGHAVERRPHAGVVEVLPVRPDRDRRHGVPVRDHRLLHLHAVRSRAQHRARLADGARDEHHPGAGAGLSVDRAAGDRARIRHPRRLEARRRRQPGHLRDRRRRDGAAVADRTDRRARRVRPDHRQRRRHRRDGRPPRGGPQRHRPARRGRQHDQGGDEGIRDRIGGARRAGAVQRVRARADRTVEPSPTSRSAIPPC